MAITYSVENVSMPAFKKRMVNEWIKQVAALYGKQVGSVHYRFCDDETILTTNREFLQHDYYTDVITFDESTDRSLEADILISLDTVRSNAHTYLQPYKRELLRVMVHGVLHLCGELDKSPEQEQAMRTAEERALSLLPADLSELWHH